MTIKGLMIDPITNMPIIVLRDGEGERILPIWVGVFEANAIALRVEEIETPRPMTHDLLQMALTEVGVEVEKILISDLQEKARRNLGEDLTLPKPATPAQAATADGAEANNAATLPSENFDDDIPF